MMETPHEAIKICQRCPVSDPCFEEGMRIATEYGTWGGMSRSLRLRMEEGDIIRGHVVESDPGFFNFFDSQGSLIGQYRGDHPALTLVGAWDITEKTPAILDKKAANMRTKNQVVAISGRKRHGKNTLASEIEEEIDRRYGGKVRVRTLGFADEIRSQLWEENPLNLRKVLKENRGWEGVKDTEYGLWVRKLMQEKGTALRKDNPDYFADLLAKKIATYNPRQRVVTLITDLRFPNEAEVLRKNFGVDLTIVKVVRDIQDDGDSHESETSVDLIKEDFWVPNNAGIEDLAMRAAELVDEILGEENAE